MSKKNSPKLDTTAVVSDFLAYIQIPVKFDEWELELLKECIYVKKVIKGTTLLNIGEVSALLYFVNKGCLRTFYPTSNETEFIRCLAIEKSFCWSIPSFLNEQPSNECIDALCDSELIVIDKTKLKELNKKSLNFRTVYQLGLETLCVNYARRIEGLLTMTAKSRYEMLIAKSPAIILKLPNKIVASYLGITQESLSRIKKKQGVVKTPPV